MNGITAALTGRLGSDGELKYSANGNAYVTINVAVDDAKRAEGAATEWIRATVWGETAEQVAPRLVKGAGVYLEGRLRLETWTTKEGEQRSTVKLSAWTCAPMGQIGRQRPRQDDPPRRPRAMPQQMAIGAGAGRNIRQELGLDDDGLSEWPD
jgi:single-strand DNA-binding protein